MYKVKCPSFDIQIKLLTLPHYYGKEGVEKEKGPVQKLPHRAFDYLE